MNWYNPANIKSHIKISQYLTDQGVKVVGNRAVAEWRDGKRMSVSIDDAKGLWHDFTNDDGGDIIALCIKVEGGSFISACRELGDRYHLDPDKTSRKPKKVTRGEMLVADGYQLTRTYTYQNDDGSPRYWVDRYERLDANGAKEKEFVQRGPDEENLHGIEKTIYNLPAVIAADRVFVVEGEKDAERLMTLGLTATTNSGGAKFWDASFNAHFTSKEVVVIPDNDAVGKEHGDIIAASVAPFAKSVRVLTISKLPKGDVSDWLDREGGTLNALLEAVKAADATKLSAPAVAAAKLANKTPLLNYTTKLVEIEGNDGKTRQKEVKTPRFVGELCEDTATRFLGFPKRLGGVLFDYTRKGKKILPLIDNDDLKAWVDGTSGHQSDFQGGSAFCSYRELYRRLLQTRPCYDVIARAPWFPVRDDAFAAYDAMPSPDPIRTKLDELMAFFQPATPADRTLIKAFFFAPMFNTPGARPAWVIDTVDAQGSGKTTVVKACGWIYDEQPLGFDLRQMSLDVSKVKRELLSSEGRARRLVLFDNVTTSFKGSAIADMITTQAITGMAPYGRTSETRRNDITWCATVNGVSVDSDMATRSYIIHIKSPDGPFDPTWEKRLRDFIDANRPQILSDILESLRTATPRQREKSRFGEFDAVVLSAAAKDDAEFAAADAAIRAAGEAANDDADLAAQCVEALTNALASYDEKGKPPLVRTDLPVVLKCSDVDGILRRTSGGVRNWTSRTVRKFVNAGQIRNIVKGVERIKTADGKRYTGDARCFIFSPNTDILKLNDSVQFVVFDGNVPTVAGVGRA